ncbi:uncharacterized protein [Diabrotica undecimpunctata]|uniref:uncharacterized protein n=1 Tax=Diabrotica undecimpunctata TaxID=50387 RepID=UPI003B637C0A
MAPAQLELKMVHKHVPRGLSSERCRDEAIIPTCMKLSFHKNNHKTKNILKRASLALTREAIQDSRRDIDKVNSELLKLYLTLSNKVHPIMWNIFDKLTNFRSETDADLTKKKQIKKFEKLILQQRPKNKELPTTESSNLVYNFSNLTLDEATNSVLSKGFNFAIAPTRIPIENIISEVETTITKLPSETAEIIRQDVSQILRTAKIKNAKGNGEFSEKGNLECRTTSGSYKCSIPYSTLKDRLNANNACTAQLGRNPIFSSEQE